MPRFFQHMDLPAEPGDTLRIAGQDGVHIRRSLRMQPGDSVTVCDGRGNDYATEIAGFDGDEVVLSVTARTQTVSEPSVKVTLYQGFPKGEKMEWIIQKAVELGVARIVPVVTSRSIAKPGDKAARKTERWQKIADEAAGQCGRGILPEVAMPMTFREALPLMTAAPLFVCYEAGGKSFSELLTTTPDEVGLFVGPEGGISPAEIEALTAAGAQCATLGKRILRCETAPLAALTLLMGLTGNMD